MQLKEETKAKIKEYIESIVTAVILALLIRTFVIQAFKIPSGSMEDTLKIGDHLLVCKFIYGTRIPWTDIIILPITKPKRGDIVVFKYPKDPKRDFIKRCIAVPGDKVEIRNKTLYVNNQILDESYIIHRDSFVQPPTISQRDFFGPEIIPPDNYFMMGDNRDTSLDSRFWGCLPYNHIRGKALVKYWPPWRIGLIK
ncbi:MAG: signal peptidase I [Candidatus Firestonebacteria bacterium]